MGKGPSIFEKAEFENFDGSWVSQRDKVSKVRFIDWYIRYKVKLWQIYKGGGGVPGKTNIVLW